MMVVQFSLSFSQTTRPIYMDDAGVRSDAGKGELFECSVHRRGGVEMRAVGQIQDGQGGRKELEKVGFECEEAESKGIQGE